MLKFDHTKVALALAAQTIVDRARRNLDRRQPVRQNDGKIITKRISASFNLWRSLKVKPVLGDGVNDPLSVEIDVADYGAFVDLGVSGTRHSTPDPSPFSFKNEGVSPDMQLAIFEWMRTKRIRLRDVQGRFAKGKITDKSYENMAYVIARSIKRKGIAQTYFLTNPFNEVSQKLPTLLEKAIGQDIENYLKEK
jgi:hypothetical protein